MFPSFYEGFGIPPLEAISAGAKCIIVSDIEVMHEIYGNGTCYINPFNYEYDLKTLLENFESKSYQSNLVILKKYSWKSSAINLHYILNNSDARDKKVGG